MRVLVGGFYHESNTFNPNLTNITDFILYESNSMLNKVASTEVFLEAGVEVIPSIYSFSLPSGIVSEDAYRFFADKILNAIKKEKYLDGIWLHLHGAMVVENIGSCEIQLLKEIREIVGFEIPISLTLDIHANNHTDLSKYANIIRSYRTVPHVDQKLTEQLTAKYLINFMKNKNKVFPIIKKLPMIISGETALGNREPLKSIFKKLEEVEKLNGILSASFFVGFSWADTEYTGSSIVVVPESEEFNSLAQEVANELADLILKKKDEFKFASLALKPKDAIEKAIKINKKPVFISDSGDNTTGGAIGTSTIFLREIIKYKDLTNKKICIASIYDEDAFDYCSKKVVGELVEVPIGKNSSNFDKSITIKGVLKSKGALMGYLGFTTKKVGEVCTLSAGNIDIVIANKPYSFITVNHFKEANLDLNSYDIIVVKQGYLFSELESISKFHILALTSGATYQIIKELKYENVSRPIIFSI